MKRKEFLKRIISIICVVALALPSFSTVMAAEIDDIVGKKETAQFGISFLNKEGWGYRIQDRLTYRVYEEKDSKKDYSRDIYCLDYTKKFPKENNNKGNYSSTGDLTDEIKNKDKVRTIAENMYLTSLTDEEKEAILSKIFADIIERTSTDANPVTLEYIMKTITEDDIFFAQQCAIWKYTNNLEWQGTAIWLTNKENPTETEWYQISNVGEARFAFMQEIYNYLTSDKLTSESEKTNPSLQKSTKTSTEVEDGYIVGPFHIKTGTNEDYTLKLTDQTGSELTKYTLVDKDGNRLSTKLKETLNKDFYVKVPLKTTSTKIILTLNYNEYKTTTKLWKNDDKDAQPLLEIERERIPGEDIDEAPIDKPEKIYDLALRKYIVKVGDKEITNRTPEIVYNKADKEINYNHKKDPVVLNAGDNVVYNITVYNEGNQKGAATRVKDYLPEGLEFVKNSEINKKYGWISSQDGSYVVTAYTKDYTLDPFDESTGKISSITLQVECKVKETVTSGILTNIAEIVEDNIDDIDSEPGSIDITKINLPDYKGKDSNKSDLTDSKYFYRGQEDDDDFEKVTVEQPKIDLALRKYISTVNGENKNREPVVDVTPLKNGETTAKYTHSKEPVTVQKGDIVVYSIRIYNEGDIDAYANEITDYIPEGLGFIVNHKINYENGWKIAQDQTPKTIKLNTIEEYQNKLSLSDFVNTTSMNDVDVVEGKVNIKSNKLKYTEGSTENLIEAFNENKTELSSKVLQVACIVLDDAEADKIIKNIAAITAQSDSEGKEREDRDSQPEEIDTTTYPDNSNIQDDDDFEKLKLTNQIYDLALQKFITKVNDKEITSRIPEVSIENGKITYSHTKDPLTVVNTSTVVYTIRVYNEGNVDAYVEEVKDDIPDGLVFLPDHEINKKYEWKLYDENGKEVSDIEDAKYVRTRYLSEEESTARGEDNQLKAFDSKAEISDKNPDYRDVQVAFKVDQSKINSMDKIIRNIAEITDDNGDDIDSTPDNDKEGEDDIDDEFIQLKNFDLALLKYVTKVVVNEDGLVKEINTGHDGTENPEPVVKVEINRKKLDKTSVTFIYTIKVTNEGEIEGYAKEVKDRIPEGLEFYQEDNPSWKVVENGIVTTDALANTLLKPGESATVEIALRWKKDENNLGTKINTAEISKDENEYNVPDIDSTPDNNKDGEDDQDTAPVVLSISTGATPTNIILTITVATIMATGIYAIKKYVL